MDIRFQKISRPIQSRRRAAHPLITMVCWLTIVIGAQGHDVGLSTATVRLKAELLQTELTFAVRDVEALADLDTNKDGKVSHAEFANARDRLNQMFATNCTVRCDADMLEPTEVRCQLDDTNNVFVNLDFPTRSFKELEMRFDVIREMTPGHRMFVTLVGPLEEILAERLINQDSPVITIVLDSETIAAREGAPQTFLGFLILGVEHIGMGYDHLLFLFALLIVTRTFKASLLVITSFTLAHTITLGVATLGWFALKPSITEPLIALSIVYVGVENLLRKGEPKGRWLLTFAFGLIHGFGFASVLRDLGVGAGGGGVAVPLLSFNLGVELGQLVIAAIVLPVIWQLGKKEWFARRAVPICSVVIALAGTWWFVQRVWL